MEESENGFTLKKSTVRSPTEKTASVLIPNCFRTLRCISATRTLSITCSLPVTATVLTTFLASPVN